MITKKYSNQISKIHKALNISNAYSKEHKLDLQVEAKRLTYVGMEPRGRDHFLEPKTAKAWIKLKKAAKQSGNDIILISGFRSVARQHYLIEEKIKKGESIAEILTRLAAPGYSEHHTGTAIDVATPDDPELDERFEKTAAFNWLIQHAGNFGFHLSYPRNNQHAIIYEPWHWKFKLS